MSLVIAEVKDGVVYMGADTQASGDVFKENFSLESNLKIIKMPHGIVIGCVGTKDVARVLTCHKDWFEELNDKPLSKEFLTTKIVPKFYNELKELDWLKENAPAEHACRFLIAQKDKLFILKDNFTVNIVPRFCAIGCGEYAAEVVNADTADMSVNEKMLNALRLADRFDNAVGAPYVFIDTKNLKFEFVED